MRASSERVDLRPAVGNGAPEIPQLTARTFEEYLTAIVHDWSKVLTTLAFTLVPAFFILDYFLVPPAFAFAPTNLRHIWTLAAFLVTSLVVSTYALRVRRQAEPADRSGATDTGSCFNAAVAAPTRHVHGPPWGSGCCCGSKSRTPWSRPFT